MSFDPPSEPQIEGLGPKRPSLGAILTVFIVLAGIIAMVAVLVAYGLVGAL